MDSSTWDHLRQGDPVLWVLVACSVVAVAVAIERAIVQWQFTTRARALADAVSRCLNRGAVSEGRSACERSPSPLADVFLVGYERLGRGRREHLGSAVHRERLRVAGELRSRLWMLATIGATAPFIGLLGTVEGIRSAMGGFRSGEVVTMDRVGPPVSEALIVTGAGIVVAVLAMVLYNYFNQRAGRIGTELKLLTDEFLESLAEAPPESTSTGDGATSAKATGKDKADGRQAA
ncbi:MAG: MotA/TolQ/ExbB proton channel family protein [Kofleriaceae bacterium]